MGGWYRCASTSAMTEGCGEPRRPVARRVERADRLGAAVRYPHMDNPLVIFGCGYIGGRLARAALEQGRKVRVCARGTARLQPLAALGAEIKFVDAARPKQFGPALVGMPQATVVHMIPPV